MFDFIRSYLNCSSLCVCFTTKRLLFNVSHEMLQRLTIIEEAISFNLQCACFATIINILYKHVCFRPLWPWILLHRYFFLCSIFSRIQRSLLKCIGHWRYIYTLSESREHSYYGTYDYTRATRPIALVHFQSSDPVITLEILFHYLTTLAFIVQNISQDLICLHRTRDALDRANFVRILFHIRLFWQKFTIQI